MILGQSPPPHKEDSGEPFCWILRPTLQLKIKANSWNEFRPTPQKDSGEPFCWILRPTLKLKIKVWILTTLLLNIQVNKANSSTEN